MFEGRKPSAHSGMGFNAMYTVLNDILPAAGSMDREHSRSCACSEQADRVVDRRLGPEVRSQEAEQHAGLLDLRSMAEQALQSIGPEPFGMAKKITMPPPDWGQRSNGGSRPGPTVVTNGGYGGVNSLTRVIPARD
ncbi:MULTISPECIES: hypothetical protein [Bradyrhizobium]|uniref:hypothetical protein n=1 Tax=Bradyrhizobium elkanii TaxID=29448 RepID=UPI0004830CF5|nr:hypothetical protein [Bradyrhizobium elkanii]